MYIDFDNVAIRYQEMKEIAPTVLERLMPLILSSIARYYPLAKDRDDLVQELLVVVLEAMLDFRESHGAHALALIASRIKYHLLNKYKKKNEECPLGEDAFLIEDQTSMDDFEALLRKDSLGNIFKSLTDEETQLIYLRYYTEMSFEDIGKRLHCSKSTAHKKVTALLKKLRRKYKKWN